ncbi:hypothetical protein [Marinoscillum sp.]|uniref:hypothetical protein n=1 Tax=Marinoscillum sp. TaxID=2024838 RepID=UPI003BA9C62D
MKKLLVLILLTGIIVLPSCENRAGDDSAPERVKRAFHVKFVEAEKVIWQEKGDSNWVARFSWHGKDYSAIYSSSGKWLETEYALDKNHLPAPILSILNQNVGNYEIEKVDLLITTMDEVYRFEIEEQGKEFVVDIHTTGTLTKQAKS